VINHLLGLFCIIDETRSSKISNFKTVSLVGAAVITVVIQKATQLITSRELCRLPRLPVATSLTWKRLYCIRRSRKWNR